MAGLHLFAQFFQTLPQFFNLTFGFGQIGSRLLQFLTQLSDIGSARGGILRERIRRAEAQQGADRLETQRPWVLP